MKFSEMSISARTASALVEMGYVDATEVQEKAIPLLLQGEDIIVRSQTGTGKTAAFGIGLIEIISKDRTKKGLILAPTRELALQITKEIRSIAQNHNLHIFAVYGGAGMGGQTASLRRGFDILVATPGRLLDHIQRGSLKLSYSNIIVLDEADRMLDIGFKRDIDRIMGMTSRERQVLLFSATIDARIREISSEYMATPAIIEVGPVGKVQKIQEAFITLSRAEKLQKLKDILQQEPTSRTIVFVASKRGVEYVCHRLNDHNIEARYLHGGKSQSQRERAIRDFQEGRFRILIATDVAARGLHIDNVNHVINYDKADSEDTHTHRIGRTARMGLSGKATTFVETDPLPPKKRGQSRGRGGFGGRPSQHGGGNRRPRRY
ncbi:DEAD/DEAH box helicase [Candidatus Micrarchaeota archaeon]|nr:DEAD/DEAH box helicase [Candidatus Micrarchaeota archaeon]